MPLFEINIYIYIFVRMHICKHVHMYMRIYVNMCICSHAYMCMCTYMYRGTYM